MKKLRNLIAVMAMMSMAAVLTGCGDDDDDDDNDQPPGNTIVAPGDEAALTAQNKIYTVTVAGDTNQMVLTFPANGQYQIVKGDVTETGTISAAQRNVNTWTFTKTPNAGQDGAQAGTVRLDFTTADQGTWTFTPDGGTAETGTFGLTTTGGNGDGGDNGGGGGDLSSVAGKTLQLNYQPTGGEKFAFGTDNSVSYENGAETGTYTYDATAHRVNVALSNGWLYDIVLAEGGTATVNFQQSGGTVETQSATYTLQ
jgi:hypothetical protein